ncbi:MAG TPA: hypothetical protein VHE30_07985 [Polyangiaceae bacterium]|nr:hypothetical protein [Polyangiaceae bacterium]
MYLVLLFLHFIGLALGVGTGFATLALGGATRDLAPPERAAFMLRASAVGRNGGIGLGLLILTGVGMMLMRGVSETFSWGGPAFHAKLGLVVVFCGVFGYLQSLVARAKREQGGPAMAKIAKISPFVLLMSLAIVACAVIAFR